jgi:hypothetical protein
MCATAAVGDGATLQPGVDNHRDTALAQLLGMQRAAAPDICVPIPCSLKNFPDTRLEIPCSVAQGIRL